MEKPNTSILSSANSEFAKAIGGMGITAESGCCGCNASTTSVAVPHVSGLHPATGGGNAPSNDNVACMTSPFSLPPNASIAMPDNSIVRPDFGSVLDSIGDTTFNGEEASIALGNGFLRFKPLKYLFKVCNDIQLEKRVADKSIRNPFKTKFLHDLLLYLLLYRSDLMLMSCASDTDKWGKEQVEEYQNLRASICNVHKKLKECAGYAFRPNVFQDYRGYNYFSKEMFDKLLGIFAQLQLLQI